MSQPLFSLLVAQYNNGKYFKECYDSIIAQSYTNWEVVIVDDCSTDDSVAVMKDIIGSDKRFKLSINSQNEGCGYTKRRCAERATGELIAFLDPDDAITEDALQVMVLQHSMHADAAAIYSKLYFCDEHLNIQYAISSEQIENGLADFFDLDGKMHHFFSFKKLFYDKTVGISSYLKRAVDKDMVLKLYEAGPCIFTDIVLYKYRIHDNGISTRQNEEKAYFWYWVAIIDAARRRNINIESLYVEKALISRRDMALQNEIDGYNRSYIFKALRKVGLFRI